MKFAKCAKNKFKPGFGAKTEVNCSKQSGFTNGESHRWIFSFFNNCSRSIVVDRLVETITHFLFSFE